MAVTLLAVCESSGGQHLLQDQRTGQCHNHQGGGRVNQCDQLSSFHILRQRSSPGGSKCPGRCAEFRRCVLHLWHHIWLCDRLWCYRGQRDQPKYVCTHTQYIALLVICHAGFCAPAVYVGSLNTVRPVGRLGFPIPLHLHALPDNSGSYQLCLTHEAAWQLKTQ